jgi:long-chain acyl-CoA synthetase
MITNFLLNSTEKFPTKSAIIFEDTKITYSDLTSKSFSLANFLKTNSSNIISLFLSNSIDFVISYFGILASGNICHIIPPSISDSNLIHQLKLINPSLIISNKILQKKLLRTKIIPNIKFLDIESFYFENTTNFHTKNEPTSIAMILFSAGTTSIPKAVQLSHNNVENTVNRVSSFLKITENDLDVISLPLSHSFGLGCLNCIIKSGGTVILHKNTLNMPKVISSIKDYSATSFASTPTTFQQIMDNYKSEFQNSINSIRYILTNSSPMPNELTNDLLEILKNKKLYTYYGLTEASRSTFHLYKKHDDKINSVGKPLSGVTIKIIKNSNECKSLEHGEILIKGNHVSPGYWKHIQNEQKFENNWLHTGDIGYFDKDGYLFLVGRKDDLINVGGEKVFPKEIEDVLKQIDEIDDVAVKGIPDKLLGQIIKAYIVTKNGIELKDNEIYSFCKGKLENYKIPKTIEFLEKLPKNDQGKLLRNKL